MKKKMGDANDILDLFGEVEVTVIRYIYIYIYIYIYQNFFSNEDQRSYFGEKWLPGTRSLNYVYGV